MTLPALAEDDVTLIKQALDTGARNIVVPMVTTRAEAEQAVAALRSSSPHLRCGASRAGSVPCPDRSSPNRKRERAVILEEPPVWRVGRKAGR